MSKTNNDFHREIFERWVREKKQLSVDRFPYDADQSWPGEYKTSLVSHMWDAWKAAMKAAMKLNLHL